MNTSQAFYTKLIASLIFSVLVQNGRAQDASPKGASADNAQVEGYEQAFPAMGTLVRLKAFHNRQETVAEAFKAVEKEVRRLEKILSDYAPESETSQLTGSATMHSVPVSDDLWEMLQASNRWYEISAGAFDSALGQLTQLWRKHRRARRVPKPELVQQAISKSGWANIKLADSQSVQFQRSGIKLDFGGIGKGFIIDRAFEVLQAHGVEAALIDISGNMRCGKAPPGRKGWLIAIAGLERGGKPLRVVSLANQSIATSGDLWQFQIIDGVKRSHILDPKTGWGVAGPVAATVICKMAVDADAAATIGCIAAPTESIRLVSDLGGEILIAKLDEEGELREITSSNFPKQAVLPDATNSQRKTEPKNR